MKIFIYIPILLLFAGCAGTKSITYNTSTDDLLSFSSFIETDFLRKHLEVIAHDSLGGRGTGTQGIEKAAAYIAEFYEELQFTPKGDDGSWFQHYTLNASITDSLVYTTYRIEGTDTLRVNHSVESIESYGEYYRLFGGSAPIAADIVFAGFGVNDPSRGVLNLDSADISGNWVLLFEDIPHIVDGDTLINPQINSNDRLSLILRESNARGILFISEQIEEEYTMLARMQSKIVGTPENLTLEYLDSGQSRSGFPVGFKNVHPELAAEILGLSDPSELESLRDGLIQNITKFRAHKTGFYLDYTPYSRAGAIESKNVLAYLEGTDPDLKDEVVVLLAHYDHMGIGEPDASGDMIYNGADDNGSGTVALMAIANALNEARQSGFKPKRSILFLHVSGEEAGLLGSRYYSDHPVIPIENTIANFNADMIGRSDPEQTEAGDTDYVYLIGGDIISSELDSIVVAANKRSVNMQLNRRYNDLSDPSQIYRRSDHWNFGRFGVPFVFFFTGLHADYHRPSDTVDKIEFDKYSRVVQLIYTSSVKVANSASRPQADNQEFIDITGRIPR